MTLPHLQALAASMQALARPNPDQAHPFVIRTRLAQLDFVFWGHEWDVLASSAFDRWTGCRAGLLGQLVAAERIETTGSTEPCPMG